MLLSTSRSSPPLIRTSLVTDFLPSTTTPTAIVIANEPKPVLLFESCGSGAASSEPTFVLRSDDLDESKIGSSLDAHLKVSSQASPPGLLRRISSSTFANVPSGGSPTSLPSSMKNSISSCSLHNMNVPLLHLPQEIVEHILDYLDDITFCNLRLASKVIWRASSVKQIERQHRSPIRDKLWNAYAIDGMLDLMQLLHKRGVEGCSMFTMDLAAKSGHLEVVRWLHENRKEGCSKRAIDWAAENGQLEIIKFLCENRKEGCTPEALSLSVIHGHLQVTMYLIENNLAKLSPEVLFLAASNGHVHIVQWLFSVVRFSVDRTDIRNSMTAAASNGHLDVLQWMYNTSQIPCNGKAMLWAASNGHMPVVQWLYKTGMTGDISAAIVWAEANGHLDIVNFLRTPASPLLRRMSDLITRIFS